MKENVSGCFFLNTVYIVVFLLLIVCFCARVSYSTSSYSLHYDIAYHGSELNCVLYFGYRSGVSVEWRNSDRFSRLKYLVSAS